MTLANRNLVTIDDLSNGEILALFSLADEMSANMTEQYGLCRGKIMASLFFEPSTRTRLSFEAAMHRLGGSVITASDVGASSLAKGESIADTAQNRRQLRRYHRHPPPLGRRGQSGGRLRRHPGHQRRRRRPPAPHPDPAATSIPSSRNDRPSKD